MAIGDRLQTAITGLDRGPGLALLHGFFFVVFAAAALGVFAVREHRGLREPAAMEAAQLARSLARGEGYTTGCVRPADLAWLERHGKSPAPGSPIPDIRHPPLYPRLLALAFRLAGTSFDPPLNEARFAADGGVMLGLNLVLTFASSVLVLLLGKRLFGAPVGAVAAVAYLVSLPVLDRAISGGPLPLATLLALSAAWAASEADAARQRSHAVLHGLAPLLLSAVLAGLAFLAHYGAIAIVLPVALLAAGVPRHASARWALLFLVVVLAVATPWMLRNQRVSGAPLGAAPAALMNGTPLYPDDGFDRSPEARVSPTRIAGALRAKLAENLPAVTEVSVRTLGSGLLVCLFLVSFFHPFGQDQAERLRWTAGAALLLLGFGAALGDGAADRRLEMLLPFVALYGAAFLFAALEYREYLDPAWRTVFTWLVVLLAAVPALLRLLSPGGAAPYPPYYPPFAAHAAQAAPPGELLATDIPWATSWYGDRPSMLLPESPEALLRMADAGLPVAGVYLTQRTGAMPAAREATTEQAFADTWQAIYQRRLPDRFPFPTGIAIPAGTRDQLLLTPAADTPADDGD